MKFHALLAITFTFLGTPLTAHAAVTFGSGSAANMGPAMCHSGNVFNDSLERQVTALIKSMYITDSLLFFDCTDIDRYMQDPTTITRWGFVNINGPSREQNRRAFLTHRLDIETHMHHSTNDGLVYSYAPKEGGGLTPVLNPLDVGSVFKKVVYKDDDMFILGYEQHNRYGPAETVVASVVAHSMLDTGEGFSAHLFIPMTPTAFDESVPILKAAIIETINANRENHNKGV